MEFMLFLFIFGIVTCFAAFFSYPHLLYFYKKAKEIKEGRKFILAGFISSLIFVLILGLIFLGIITLFISLVMSIIVLSDYMFNAFSPGTIEYKEFLDIIVKITSIFGSVIIAAAAYLFKKKS